MNLVEDLNTFSQPFFNYLLEYPLPLEGSKLLYEKIDYLTHKVYDSQNKNKRWRVLTKELNTIYDLTLNDNSTTSPHYPRNNLYIALLRLCLGQMDAAHSISTQYSWPYATSFSDSPIINSPLYLDACCVHSMIHRFEGLNNGEYGTGFYNGLYWANHVSRHPVEKDLVNILMNLLNREYMLNNNIDQDCLNLMKPLTSLIKNKKWSIEAFIHICETSVQTQNIPLKKFCYDISLLEIKLLLQRYSHQIY